MNQQPCVAENLELLADFGPDISIIRMKPLQFTVVSINLVVGESPSPIGWERVAGRLGEGQPSHDVQHVECPAAFFGFDLAERFDATELRADFFRRGDQCGTGLRPVFSACGIGFGNRNRQDACSTLCHCRDDGDAGFGRDAVQWATCPVFFTGYCSPPSRPVLRSKYCGGWTRRAVAASGFRLMTADSENMNEGIRSRSRTSQVARA